MLMQNFIKLSAAVTERTNKQKLSDDAENNTAFACGESNELN